VGRPPKFSRQRLQDAALAIVDEKGSGALSMRVLAAALGTGPMTLYNHVAGREDLDVLVVDAVLSRARWSRQPDADWRAEVREIALAGWRAVREHPRAIPLILTRRTRSTAALEMAEALLAALARSGCRGRRLLVAFRAVMACIMGFAQGDLAGPLAAAASENAAEVLARVLSLPPDRFAHLIEIAAAARDSSAEEEFLGGLDLLLAGLEAQPAAS